MGYKKLKHNTPISTVIRGYLDKDGGKVTASRKEIEWRFNALDWRHQKQILFAFLKSGKSDREWAYGKLYATWDECFIPVLQDLWEQHHEIQLSWLIIRFFPIGYLKKEFESLSAGRNYYFLYQRLADDREFVLDKTRLSEGDLLRVMHASGEVISNEMVMTTFYLLVYKMCKGIYTFKAWENLGSEGKLLAIFGTPVVKSLIDCVIFELERHVLVEEIQEWMSRVTDSYMELYGNLNYNGYSYSEKEEYIRRLMKSHCLKHIDPEYLAVWDTFDPKDQQQFLDYLSKRNEYYVLKEVNEFEKGCQFVDRQISNPPYCKLVEGFDLEMVDPLPY